MQSTTNNLSIQLDKYKLITINQISNNSGIKKLKKILEIADNRSLISLTYTGNSDKKFNNILMVVQLRLIIQVKSA